MNEYENNVAVPEESGAQTVPAADAGPSAQQEPAPESYFETNTVTPSAPVPGKKIPVVLIAVIAVVVAALIAVGTAAAIALFEPAPREAVERAWAASTKAGKDEMKTLKEEYPLYAAVFGTETASAQTGSYTLTLQDLKGVEGAAMIANILRGTGIRVDYATDPDNAAVEFTADVLLTGEELVGLYGYLSPTIFAANVPSFSDTVLSLSPETLAEDYQNSVFYDESTGGEEIEELKKQFSSFGEYFEALGNANNEQMIADLMEICGQALANAEFTRGEDDGGYKTYLISVPGTDVKKLFCDLMRYIYLDSEIGRAMTQMQSTVMGEAYEQQINEMLTELDEDLPELPAEIRLSVDGKRVIRSAVVSAVMDESWPGKKLELAVTGNPQGIFRDISFEVLVEEDGVQQTITMTAVSCDEDDAYTNVFNMDVDIEGMQMNMSMPITVGKDGSVSIMMDAVIKEDGASDLTFNFDCAGTATEEGGKTILDLPGSSLGGSFGDAQIMIGFDMKSETAPLSAPITGPAEHTPFLSMSEQQLEELYNEYEQGISGLAGAAYSILMEG